MTRGAQARPAALTTAAVSPTYTAPVPVMMGAKKNGPWSILGTLKRPAEKFAGGLELLSDVSRPRIPSKMNVDGSQYARSRVRARAHVAAKAREYWPPGCRSLGRTHIRFCKSGWGGFPR